MSLYNILFGMNSYADLLLAMLNLDRSQTGRFRDCYTNNEGTEIIIHTRNGGGNRECYQETLDALSKHPNWIRDEDDGFDCTYADIHFSVPAEFKDAVKRIADNSDTRPRGERWRELLASMESGKDNAVVSRAIEVGKKIVEGIQQADQKDQNSEIKTPDGSVLIKTMK